MNWWLVAMKKYVDFSGRARRKEYWMFFLFNIIFAVLALILDNLLGTATEDGTGIIYNLFSFAILLPTIAVTVRRLHDVGKSGWWILISLIPIIGGIWLFILMVTNSQVGDNQYGPNPKMNKEESMSSNFVQVVSNQGGLGKVYWYAMRVSPNGTGFLGWLLPDGTFTQGLNQKLEFQDRRILPAPLAGDVIKMAEHYGLTVINKQALLNEP